MQQFSSFSSSSHKEETYDREKKTLFIMAIPEIVHDKNQAVAPRKWSDQV
jgi:hypothetical protein